MSGIQHQPLQKHDAVCSSPHAPAQNGSSFRASSSGKVSNAAVWEALDMSPMSAVSCGRPSQDCQLSDLSQGISAHVAAWQKQHSMSMSACPTSSRRAPEGLPLSGRQPSARGRSSAGEARTCVAMQLSQLSFLMFIANCINNVQTCTPILQHLAAAPTRCSVLLCICCHMCLNALLKSMCCKLLRCVLRLHADWPYGSPDS